jgi:hypothetical protein
MFTLHPCYLVFMEPLMYESHLRIIIKENEDLSITQLVNREINDFQIDMMNKILG